MRKKYSVYSIFGMPFTVYLTDELEPNIVGLCLYDTQTILIKKDLDQESFNVTLIHELLHAFMRRLGYENALTMQTEEILIDQIAKMLNENFTLKQRKQKG